MSLNYEHDKTEKVEDWITKQIRQFEMENSKNRQTGAKVNYSPKKSNSNTIPLVKSSEIVPKSKPKPEKQTVGQNQSISKEVPQKISEKIPEKITTTSQEKSLKEDMFSVLKKYGYKKEDFKDSPKVDGKSMENIINMCEYFSEYVDDIIPLIKNSISNKARIHVCGLTTHKDSRCYVGNFTNVIKTLPFCVSFTLIESGDLLWQNGFGNNQTLFSISK